MAELAWESRLASPLWVEGQSVNLFKSYIGQRKDRWPESLVVGAYRNQELVDWTALIIEDPEGCWRRAYDPDRGAAKISAPGLGKEAVNRFNAVIRPGGGKAVFSWGRPDKRARL